MKRLLLSSNFWNAIIASIILIIATKMGMPSEVLLMVGGLFGARSVATGVQDVKWNKGIGGTIPPDDDEQD